MLQNCMLQCSILRASMLSVVIATQDCARALVPTLATLVAGAAGGVIREVIVADGGSKDDTVEVADIAGCDVTVSQAPLAARLRAATASARAPWIMFVTPGTVLDATWVAETARFTEQAELQGMAERRAAVFRKVPTAGGERPAFVDALALLYAALGGRPRPEQGLLIFKRLYDRLGGHRDSAPDPEADLIARLGRRRIALLRSGAASILPLNLR
jgi:glycosyltransferase involved in cell wall biosynthesis